MSDRSSLHRWLAVCARLLPVMLAANLVLVSLAVHAQRLPLMLAVNVVLVSLAMFLPVGALVAAAAVTAANSAREVD